MQTPDEKYKLYTIQQFSKICNIPSSTLRYYDTNGLYPPSYIDPVTGYRYYTIHGLEDLGVIQTLQEMGMSLSEIKDYFEHRSFFNSYRILNQQYEKLVKKCKHYEQLKNTLSEKIRLLDSVFTNTNYEFHVKHFPDRFGYTNYVDCKTDSDSKYQSAKIMGHYDKHLFISNAFASIIPHDDFLKKQYYNTYYCMMMDIKRDETDKIHKLFFPEGDYLCLQYFGSHFNRNPYLEKMEQYLLSNHLKIKGNIIQVCIIDENITNIDKEKINELQVALDTPIMSE